MASAKKPRPMPPIPDTGWRPPAYLPDLSSARVIAIDLETYDPELTEHGPGWARHSGHIVGVAIAVPGAKWYFPIRHALQGQYNLPAADVLAWLRVQLSRAWQPKIGANLIYDVGWLAEEGVAVAGTLHDVQNMAALLTENDPVALEYLGQVWLGEGKDSDALYQWAAQAYGGKPNSKQRANIYRCPPTLVGPYAEQDADLPLRLAEVLWPELERQGLLPVYDMETALTPLLIRMRMEGVRIDIEHAQRLQVEMLKREMQAAKHLRKISGLDINFNAAASIAVAFDKFAIPYPFTADGNPSFTKTFLEGVEHPIGQAINELRRLAKLRGTFVEGYLLNGHVNGRIHGQFHPLRSDDGGARSGRYSSSDPNLQNIPIRDDELGKLIREAFIPEYGHKEWCKLDLSQIEYRYLVHFAVGPGAEQARQMYCNDPNTDYHEYTQRLVKEHTGRDIARKPIKSINFGLVYGMGEPKLARELHMPRKDAGELFGHYHNALPFVKKTMAAAMDEARTYGTVRTILGRISRFDYYYPAGDRSAKPLRRRQALDEYGSDIELAHLHKALNRKLQGSAADAMKMAMLNCYRAGCFDIIVPRVTVHDELGFSNPGTRESEQALLEIKWHMENSIPLRVPVIAEIDRAASWGACG